TLNIIVWGHPEISTVATGASPTTAAVAALGNNTGMLSSTSNPAVSVQIDGTIFYPYVGHLKVAGLTINEIQNAITNRLAVYIRHPQITVQIAQFQNRHIYVLGEVMQTGAQPITDRPLTLMEALSKAGGINTNSADPTHIYLVRGSYLKPDIFLLNAQSPQTLLITERFPLQENDIVYVSSATLNSFNKFMQTVFPTFTTYWTIKGLSQS
ncbi:MAG: hypothetical protein ACD_45C00726G0001, partial [uncultured bacterium]